MKAKVLIAKESENMEEENREEMPESVSVSETDVNKNETVEQADTAGFLKSEDIKTPESKESDVAESRENNAEADENNSVERCECNTESIETEVSSDGSAETVVSEAQTEENSELEYGTMPGNWASYEAERQRRTGAGNGVYPDEGRINGESYFGMHNGGIYGQNPLQNSQPGNVSQKPKDKKRLVIYGILGAVALALIISVFIAGFQLFNRMFTDVGNNLPSNGEQSGQGGGTQGGGGQSGGTQNGGLTTGTPNAGADHLQNGEFTLEQVTAEEHYKYSTVYQLTESTVVAIKSSIGSGSGVIISKDEKKNDGYFIVTNNHVIEGGTDIKVTLSNGTVYDAALIGRDENTDLAILKIIASDLKVAPIGKSADLLVAEEVLIIGNPLGTLGGSATNGIISAKNRVLSIDGYEMSLLQTNAAINGGNSGGGMFNMSGQLVGIVNAKYVAEEIEGIGFAIPVDTAKPIIEDLINYGYVKGRPNLGIEVTYGRKFLEGRFLTAWWITGIYAGSDAETAGLALDDAIASLKVNGVEYSGEALYSFLSAQKLKTLKVGDELEFYVYRYSISDNNKYISLNVTVTEYGA